MITPGRRTRKIVINPGENPETERRAVKMRRRKENAVLQKALPVEVP